MSDRVLTGWVVALQSLARQIAPLKLDPLSKNWTLFASRRSLNGCQKQFAPLRP